MWNCLFLLRDRNATLVEIILLFCYVLIIFPNNWKTRNLMSNRSEHWTLRFATNKNYNSLSQYSAIIINSFENAKRYKNALCSLGLIQDSTKYEAKCEMRHAFQQEAINYSPHFCHHWEHVASILDSITAQHSRWSDTNSPSPSAVYIVIINATEAQKWAFGAKNSSECVVEKF